MNIERLKSEDFDQGKENRKWKENDEGKKRSMFSHPR